MVLGQPRQNIHEMPSQPTVGHGGRSLSSQLYCEELNRRIVVQTGLNKKQHTISKITREKRAGGMAEVVDYLPSKHKALNSNPSTIWGVSIPQMYLYIYLST
jgi:uncharacterized protein YwlG (UPF0340 family)